MYTAELTWIGSRLQHPDDYVQQQIILHIENTTTAAESVGSIFRTKKTDDDDYLSNFRQK